MFGPGQQAAIDQQQEDATTKWLTADREYGARNPTSVRFRIINHQDALLRSKNMHVKMTYDRDRGLRMPALQSDDLDVIVNGVRLYETCTNLISFIVCLYWCHWSAVNQPRLILAVFPVIRTVKSHQI